MSFDKTVGYAFLACDFQFSPIDSVMPSRGLSLRSSSPYPPPLIVNTLRLLDRGFDFTDESFYLMVAAQPAAYDLAYGLWGYGLHPLYELVGGSIAHLRRAGALILVLLGAVTGVCILRIAKMNWRSAAGVQVVAVSMCVPLTYYSLWIPTPSYNWIVAVGAMFLLMAVILLYEAGHRLHSAAAAAAAAVLVLLTRPANMLGFGAIYLAAIFLAIPDGKDRRVQILRAACFTAIAVIGIAVISPLDAIVSQSREYAAIFGMARPIQFSFADQQIDFVMSQWLWPVSALAFVFAVFLRRARHACVEPRCGFDLRDCHGCSGCSDMAKRPLPAPFLDRHDNRHACIFLVVGCLPEQGR